MTGFFDLPLELRQMIYKHATDRHLSISLHRAQNANGWTVSGFPGFPGASRAARRELTPYLLGSSPQTLHFTLTDLDFSPATRAVHRFRRAQDRAGTPRIRIALSICFRFTGNASNVRQDTLGSWLINLHLWQVPVRYGLEAPSLPLWVGRRVEHLLRAARGFGHETLWRTADIYEVLRWQGKRLSWCQDSARYPGVPR